MEESGGGPLAFDAGSGQGQLGVEAFVVGAQAGRQIRLPQPVRLGDQRLGFGAQRGAFGGQALGGFRGLHRVTGGGLVQRDLPLNGVHLGLRGVQLGACSRQARGIAVGAAQRNTQPHPQ